MQFCTLSSGGYNPFWSSRKAPVYGTEGAFTASGERQQLQGSHIFRARRIFLPLFGLAHCVDGLHLAAGVRVWAFSTHHLAHVLPRLSLKRSSPLPAVSRTPSLPAVIGCTYYVIAAWIWAIIWHFGLDPLKVRCAAPAVVCCLRCACCALLPPNTAPDHVFPRPMLVLPGPQPTCAPPTQEPPSRPTAPHHPSFPPPSLPLQWIMMYLADEEGMRSAGGGMFTNIFRLHGERMGADANIGINKVGTQERWPTVVANTDGKHSRCAFQIWAADNHLAARLVPPCALCPAVSLLNHLGPATN